MLVKEMAAGAAPSLFARRGRYSIWIWLGDVEMVKDGLALDARVLWAMRETSTEKGATLLPSVLPQTYKSQAKSPPHQQLQREQQLQGDQQLLGEPNAGGGRYGTTAYRFPKAPHQASPGESAQRASTRTVAARFVSGRH